MVGPQALKSGERRPIAPGEPVRQTVPHRADPVRSRCCALSLGVAVNDHNRHQAAAERAMDDEAGTHASTLDASMARARTITLIMAHNAAFRGFYLEPGSRASKLRRGSHVHRRAPTTPSSTSRACSPTRSASCASSTAAARRTPASCTASAPRSPTSRPTRRSNPFFGPTFALRARAGLPVPAVRVARHARLGRRQRHADPAGPAAPLGGDRPLRAVRRELPAPAARRRRRIRPAPRRRADRPRGHRQLAPSEGRRAARRPRRPPLRGPRATPAARGA